MEAPLQSRMAEVMEPRDIVLYLYECVVISLNCLLCFSPGSVKVRYSVNWRPEEETKEEFYERVEEVFEETKSELPGEHTLDPVENVVQTGLKVSAQS